MRCSALRSAAFAASALAHVVLFWVLSGRSTSPPGAGPSGVVSVAFVAPVTHEPPVGPSVPAPRRTPRPTSPGPAAAPPASARPAAGLGADETGRFVGEVGRLIDQRKSYPRPALNRELEGRVVVAITLDAGGALLGSEVEEPSPYAVLNDAALAAVRAVPAYPALPPHAGTSLHLHVPIIFKIKR